MRILLLSKYSRSGASSRLRTLQYVPYLKEHGIEVVTESLFDDAYLKLLYGSRKRSVLGLVKLYFKRMYLLLQSRDYDLVWVEKELFPYVPMFIERLFLGAKTPYIVDYDDAIFHNYDLSKSSFVRFFLANKIDKVMRNAQCVIVGNKYLGDRAKSAGASRVVLIPTVVDSSRYFCYDDTPKEQLIIGWIGSPSTQKYVVDIREALASACRDFNARVLLVGATCDIVSELPGVNTTVLPWSEATEAELINQMSIGIMPLEDGPWERGKCGYKLIQYMASGVPVIASPVGVNVDIVIDNKCGYLAGDSSEWRSAFSTLLESPGLRKALGEAGKEAVMKIYSLQVQGHILKDVLRSVQAINIKP